MSQKANYRQADREPKTLWITENDYNRLRTLIKDIGGSEITEGLRELEMQLDRARVVASNQIPENVVTMNCLVRLRDPDSLQEWECWLRFSTQSKASIQVVPIISNLGIALLGSEEGDIIEWSGPSGKRKSEIIEIVYQPERLGNYGL